MLDVRALVWLRWRQFKDTAVYWLRVLGYQPNERSFSQNMYVVYLILIGLFWVYTVGTFTFESAANVARLLTPDIVGVLLVFVAWAVFLLQVWVIMRALQSTPLKLSFPDMAYVAASPIKRSAPVIVGYVKQVLIRIFLLGVTAALLGVVIARPLDPDNYGAAALRAVGFTIPLVAITWGIGWVLGLLRLIDPRVGRLRHLWFLPLLLIPIAYLLPDPFLWIGRAAGLAVLGQAPDWLIPLLVGLMIALAAAVVFLGERINMIHAADESVLYARIQALGLMAYRQPNLQRQIYRQARQAGRKPLLRLPKATGVWTFVTRAALSYVRHPGALVSSFLWGVTMTYFAADTIINNRPLQVWILWLIVAGLRPPFGLLQVFQTDRSEPFLRQFLPVNGLQLLIADMILPLIALIAGGFAALAFYAADPAIMVMGLMFIPVSALLIALSGAVALTNRRVLQTQILATGASFGAVILAGLGLGTPAAALGVAVVAILLMAGMVATEA